MISNLDNSKSCPKRAYPHRKVKSYSGLYWKTNLDHVIEEVAIREDPSPH
jgi:hypothetical protein